MTTMLATPSRGFVGTGVSFRTASALVIPLIEKRCVLQRTPYPHIADGLVVAPFLADTLGNLLGLYDNFQVTDDVLHILNWILLVAAFQDFRFRRRSSRDDAVLLGAGFGALAIVAWEIMEWAVSEFGAAGGLALTYGDTVGDLALSTSGGIIGSLIAVRLFEGLNPENRR